MSFYEWDRLPYGCRHWTSCTTLGDKCLGDCPILAPPVLWKLCSGYEMAFKDPSRYYFWVHTKRKIAVKRIRWLRICCSIPEIVSQRNSYLLYSHSSKWQAATHINNFPLWAYTIVLMNRIYFIIYICLYWLHRRKCIKKKPTLGAPGIWKILICISQMSSCLHVKTEKHMIGWRGGFHNNVQ